MNASSFYFKCHIDTPHKFISHSELWKSDVAGIYLVKCDFNIKEYNQSIYDYLDIYFPSELSLAVKKRQAEFLAGRFCAKICMQAMNEFNEVSALPVGNNRAPNWPSGIIGSITHSSREAICAIRKSDGNRYIGVDVESVFSEVDALQLGPQIHRLQELEIVCKKSIEVNIASTLIFSAKESLFKALHPSVGAYFGFEKAQIINIDTRAQTLTIKLDDEFSFTHNLANKYRCHFTLRDDKVTTLIY